MGVDEAPPLQAGKAAFIEAFVCQDEKPARDILDTWQKQGEVARNILIAVAGSMRGEKIPTLPGCTTYSGAMTPIRNIHRWGNLEESRNITGRVSITLVEMEIYPDYVAHKVFAFLTKDIME